MKPALSRSAWLLFVLAGAAQAVVPTAPTNLSATAVSATQINLSWTDTSSNETSFKIERKTNTTNFSQVATVGSNITSFSDTGLTSATNYTYRVRASNSSGNSGYTNEASAATQGADTTAPSTPGGVNATPVSTSQINLTWNASTDAVGVSVYRVERCQGTGCTSFAEIATPSAPALNDTGLTASTVYRYRIRASDAAGNLSAYSSIATATSSSVGPVGSWGLNGVLGSTQADYSGNNNRAAPDNGSDNLIPTATGKFGNALVFGQTGAGLDIGNPAVLNIKGSMTLSAWIYSTAFPGNDTAIISKFSSATTGFQLDTTVDNGPRTVGFRLGSPLAGGLMARYSATVLQLNTWYHVAGVYDAGAQTMTVYVNGVPDNGVLTGTVAGRQLTSNYNLNIGRRPDLVSDFNFIGTIDEARIYDRALTQAEIQADMNAAIAAADTVAPTAPTNLGASVTSPTQIHLQLINSTDNFDVTGYRIERCQGVGCGNFAQIATTSSFNFDDPGLTTGTSYSYRVRAMDGAGNLSAYSSVASATPTASATGSLVGSYAFEDGTGGPGSTTVDASGYSNNGTLNGPVASTPSGMHGNALSFSGGNVDLGNPETMQFTGSMTISAWINQSDFPVNDGAIVSKRGDGENGYQLDTTQDTGVRTIGFKLPTVENSRIIRYGASALQLNQWYHVAGVYDAQAQTLNVYLNGQLDNGTLLGTVPSSQQNSPMNVLIGQRANNGYEFRGTIDDVRIYGRALTQAEIQSDMNTPATGGGGSGDTTPPTAPSGLSATAAGSSQINLSWTPSTDNVGVTGYLVERCQGAGCGHFVQIATPAATTLSDTGLTAGTSYSYRVRAADAAGNLSAYSNVASATTATGQAQMYFIEPDHLNTPRMVSSSGGTTVWRWDQSEPFGDSVPNADPDGDGIAFDFPLRFPGQYLDTETGNLYNMARDYSPSDGRYLQSDPIGLVAGLNTYLYVDGTPINALDFFGLKKVIRWDFLEFYEELGIKDWTWKGKYGWKNHWIMYVDVPECFALLDKHTLDDIHSPPRVEPVIDLPGIGKHSTQPVKIVLRHIRITEYVWGPKEPCCKGTETPAGWKHTSDPGWFDLLLDYFF